MKAFVAVLLLLLPIVGQAKKSPDLRKVFMQFEKTYLTNNAQSVEKWLASGVKISETLHLPGGRTSTVSATRSQLLQSMKRMPISNHTPHGSLKDIHITTQSNGRFCGESHITTAPGSSDRNPENGIKRKICFKPVGDGYKVTKLVIDVFY